MPKKTAITTVKKAPSSASEKKTETATARTSSGEIAPFRPENLSQAARLAGNLARSTMLPKALRDNPADILVVLITAHELGLSPMQGIRGMNVIEGKAVMSAELMSGLVQRDSSCLYLCLVESSDKVATYETMRRGHQKPTRLSYTIEQAQKAGLLGKNNWKYHPAAMLRARASSGICRAVYADLVNGVYNEDEAIEIKPVQLEPAPGQSTLDVLAEKFNTMHVDDHTVDLEPGEGAKDRASQGAADTGSTAAPTHPDGCFCETCKDASIPDITDPASVQEDDGQGVLVDI